MNRILAMWTCGAMCLLLSTHARADSDPKPELGAVLAKAAAAYDAIPKREVTEKEAIEAARPFVTLLQSVADQFAAIPTGREPGTAAWKAHTLNKEGKRLDCIRFRTPKGEPRDMAWAFISSINSIESWYIIPARGQAAAAFKNFFDLTPDANGPSVFVQSLSADALKPDTEYLLWFKLHGKEPVEVVLAINLLARGTVKDEAEDLAKVVALEDGIHKFQSLHEKHSEKN